MNSGLPPYLQIATQLENEILSGKLQPGHQISSFRVLAVQYEVSLNTVQRAIYELKQRDLLITVRGQGIRVTNDEALIRERRKTRAEELTYSFLNKMALLGYSSNEIWHLCSLRRRTD